MRYFIFATVLALLTVTFSARSPGTAVQSVEVKDPWVRAPAAASSMNMDIPGALFMVIRNGSDSSDRLLNVESDAAGIVQIHLTEVDENGVASMHPVNDLEIPARGVVELKPGGYHVMLMDVKHGLVEGEMIRFVLTFEKAGRLDIEAPVKVP